MASLLEGSSPLVAAATDEARVIFEGLGAKAWIDRLDQALAAQEASAPNPAEAADRVPASG
jgi:hypothetical protein